jgi:hypothetical protein
MPRKLPQTVDEDDRIQTSVRFPADLYDELKDEATRRMVSVNFLIVTATEVMLSQWKEQTLV